VKLHDHFDGLLHGSVNLNPTRLRQLEEHEAALTGCLRDAPELRQIVRTSIRQGSWAHRTIIKPLPGKEFDADLLVEMKRQRDWSGDPKRYLLVLHEALKRQQRYRGRLELKTRCVRVTYANQCHVDLVPYLRIRGWFEEHHIVNRRQNRFEEVNPAGFATWMRQRDRVAGGNLRTVLRLLKYLRDYKGTLDVPSVVLTVIVGGRVGRLLRFWDDRYSDLPTAFDALVKATDTWLQARPELPPLPDPSCPTVGFDHRLDQPTYEKFRDQFHAHAATIRAAFTEKDRRESIRLWRQVFGEGFVLARR
jgi:hypothetical protein